MRGNRSPEGYRLWSLLAAAIITSTLISVRSPAQSNSQVRIVRLSFVEGTVTMYRPDVDQWAQAFINTPIQQGFKVATDTNSFAEVEFENGSTARLGQSSELDFTGLSLSPEGGKINHVTLARGYASFAVKPEKGDVYDVQAAGVTYSPSAQSTFRVDLNQENQRLEVFKGQVDVQSPYGSGLVAKNQVAELTPGSAKPFQLTEGITEDDWDRWVDKRQQTQTVASNKSASGSAGLAAGSSIYGWNDLSYYGAWNDLPGYGSCWSPYMGAGWSPYTIGRWDWYPGFGYTWISGLPWGWLPFHYGNWIYPAGMGGWCWMPGNFTSWSPGLVTWYQGPNWVGWAPRPYPHGPSTIDRCPSGQNCSTVVSINTFQSGRPISPNDLVRVDPFRGHLVNSPTAPVTRSLRLPGPALSGSPFESAGETGVNSSARVRRVGAAPTSVFARSTIHGAWDIQPRTPAFQTMQGNAMERERRMHGAVTGSTSAGAVANHSMSISRTPTTGPADSFRGASGVNNDMLLRSRMAPGSNGAHPGYNPAQLTSIPISTLGAHEGTMHHSSLLAPTARPSIDQAGIRSIQEPQMPVFRQERFRNGNRSMQDSNQRRQTEMNQQSNTSQRRQVEMNQRSGMSQQRVQSAPASRPSQGGFGGGQRMSQPRENMGGGIGGGMAGGTRGEAGGGMSGGGSGSRGPHR